MPQHKDEAVVLSNVTMLMHVTVKMVGRLCTAMKSAIYNDKTVVNKI